MDDLAKRPLQDRLKRIFDGAGGSDELVELLAEFDMEGSRELADAITLALGDYSRMLGANEALLAELARVRACLERIERFGTGFYCPLWGSEECDWECPNGGMG